MPTFCALDNMKRKATWNEARAESLRDIMQFESCVWTAYQQYWDGLITRAEFLNMVNGWNGALEVTLQARILKLEP